MIVCATARDFTVRVDFYHLVQKKSRSSTFMLNQNYSRYCAVSFIRIEHSSMLGKASLHSKTLGEYSSRDHVIDDRTTHSVVRTRRQSSTGGGGPQLIQMSKTRQYLDSEKNREIDISCFMSKVYQQ